MPKNNILIVQMIDISLLSSYIKTSAVVETWVRTDLTLSQPVQPQMKNN